MLLTDALLGEHGVFYAMMHRIDGAVDERLSISMIKQLVIGLEGPLVSHARIEEEILFPALMNTPAANGPVPVMQHEHASIEGLFATIKECDDESVYALVGELLGLLRAHFAKEEKVLFGMALNFVGADKLERLGAQWAAIRGVAVSGSGGGDCCGGCG